MPWLKLEGVLGWVHVKMPRPRRRPCHWCRALTDRLCDGPGPEFTPAMFDELAPPAELEARSCSRPVCRRCSIQVPPDADYCARDPRCRAAALAAGAALRANPIR